MDLSGSPSPDQPHCPRVWLVEAISFSEFDVVTEDIVEMRDSTKLACRNYRLVGLPEDDSLYFLLSDRDLIEATLPFRLGRS